MASVASRPGGRPAPLMSSPLRAQPPSSPASTAFAPASLEDTALRLFHLLHSPPLSLATLVRAGLLDETIDVDGHRTLVIAGRVQSPTQTTYAVNHNGCPFSAAAASAATPTASSSQEKGDANATRQEPLASPVTASPQSPPPPSSSLLMGRGGGGGNGSGRGYDVRLFPAHASGVDTLGSPVTASALSLSSPTSNAHAGSTAGGAAAAAATTSTFRIARISSEALAHRLADLYAHYPPYVLREWLHKEAMRLCCPTYQDPVSNDIIATAEALRQRESLVTLYIHQYEELYPRTPSPTIGRDGGVDDSERARRDPEFAAWSRSLHLLMGCHHQRERHCPHRALDGFKRTDSHAAVSAVSSLHNVADHDGAASRAPGKAKEKIVRNATEVQSPRSAVRLQREASVALHFVQQMLHNTPPPTQRRGHHPTTNGTPAAAAAAKAGAATIATGSAGAASGSGAAGLRGVTMGPTVTFIRPVIVSASAADVGTTASTAPQPHKDKTLSTGVMDGAVPATVVTSLDCMIGVEAAEVVGEQRGGAAGQTASVPARRGPRIVLRSSASAAALEQQQQLETNTTTPPSAAATAASTTSTGDVHVMGSANDLSEAAALAPHLRSHRRRRGDGGGRRRGRSHGSASVSSSGSSSVSLSVVGEGIEDELSLLYEEGEVEEDDDDDDGGDDFENEDAEDGLLKEAEGEGEEHNTTLTEAQATGGRQHSSITSPKPNGKFIAVTAASSLGGGGSRQSSQYPAATTTTVDFLTSRNGGLLNAALTTPLTAAAIAAVRDHPPATVTTANAVTSASAAAIAVEEGRAVTAVEDDDHLHHHNTNLLHTFDVGGARAASNPSTPLLVGYTLTRPFTLAELPPTEAAALLRLPYYAQAHELNRLASLRGRTCYQDPYTNCLILTSHFLERLPHCYGEYCKHCPHGELCQRRQLHPPNSRQHHRSRHHRHAAASYTEPWRVSAAVKCVHHDSATTLAWGSANDNVKNSANSEEDSLSSRSSSSSSADSSGVDDDDDDPAVLRFFEELDAADAALAKTSHSATATDATSQAAATSIRASSDVRQDVTSAPPPPMHLSAVPSAFSPTKGSSLSSAPSSPSSTSSLADSSFSDGDEDEDEQQRRHLLRSSAAALYTTYAEDKKGEHRSRHNEDDYRQQAGVNSAGVVVHVSSLRDLLLWGHNPHAAAGEKMRVKSEHAAAVDGANVAAPEEGSAGRAVPSQLPLPDALERRENSTDAALLLGDEAAAVREEDIEEILRRHEASFDRFNFLDYSGL